MVLERRLVASSLERPSWVQDNSNTGYFSSDKLLQPRQCRDNVCLELLLLACSQFVGCADKDSSDNRMCSRLHESAIICGDIVAALFGRFLGFEYFDRTSGVDASFCEIGADDPALVNKRTREYNLCLIGALLAKQSVLIRLFR